MRQRLIGALSPPGKPPQVLPVEAFLREEGRQLAQSGPREGWIFVGGVTQEGLPTRQAIIDERRLWAAEQGTQMGHIAERRRGLHPGKTAEPAATQQSEENRLRLIVGVMGGEEKVGAEPMGMAQQQVVAHRTGAFLNASPGFFALPSQDFMRKAQVLGPNRHKLGLGAGVLTKPVVDRGNEDRCRMPAGPSRCQPHEGNRIGPSGNSEKGSASLCQRGKKTVNIGFIE